MVPGVKEQGDILFKEAVILPVGVITDMVILSVVVNQPRGHHPGGGVPEGSHQPGDLVEVVVIQVVIQDIRVMAIMAVVLLGVIVGVFMAVEDFLVVDQVDLADQTIQGVVMGV